LIDSVHAVSGFFHAFYKKVGCQKNRHGKNFWHGKCPINYRRNYLTPYQTFILVDFKSVSQRTAKRREIAGKSD
jgi:hypothetical protein